MTKLAEQIVEVMNSRNEYMEKQAGIVSFIARKIVKPASRFMFGKTDLAAAKAKRYFQSKRIFNESTKLVGEHEKLVNNIEKLQGKYPEHYFALQEMRSDIRDKIRDKLTPILSRRRNLDMMRPMHPEEAINKAKEVRDNIYRFGRDLGIFGGASVAGGVAGRLTTPEPTLFDVFNNYIEKIRK